jgi:hypothetical protein
MYNACVRIFLGCLLLLLSFLLGCSCPSGETVTTPPTGPSTVTKPDPEYAMKLAKQFCPIFYFNGEAETEENYEPDPVQLMVDTSVVRDSENPGFSEKATISNMLNWTKSAYYIDVVDLNPKKNSSTEYKAVYDSLKEHYKPTVYTRVKEADSSGYTIIQYWLFYYMNDWRNIHEGDWELVQLNFPGQSVKEIFTKGEAPVFMALSQHQSGQKMSWNTMNEKRYIKETHPIVYVARGSHANYFTPGQFWSVLDFDNTGQSSWRIIEPGKLDMVLLNEADVEEEGLEWLQFKGDWGEYTGLSISLLELRFWQSGPPGPPWSEGGKKSEKWESPGKWAAGLSEYPEPFWKSLLKLPGDWSKLAIFSLFSPADLHVYDSQGRHVGINEEGGIESQIPGAMYIIPEGTDYKIILIPDAEEEDEYTIVAKGTDSGSMDLKAQVPDAVSKLRRFVEYVSIPVSRTMIARTKIKPTALGLMRAPSTAEVLSGTTRDTATVLEIDSDGDGTFEIESAPGKFEKQKILRSVIGAKIDVKPDVLSFSSAAVEKSITVYIELPADFSPEDIDLSTVLLFGKIGALQRSMDVTDHDQNGISELVVKFDRQSVINYLTSIKQAEGEIVFNITGTMKGQPFTGSDTVAVSKSVPEPTIR